MPFHKFILLCFVLIGLLSPVSAQQHEFGAVVGISGYVGELARKSTLFNSGARANDRFIAFDNGGISAFYTYRFSPKQESFLTRGAGLRANLSYMRISAEQDGNSFRSEVYEIAVLYERDIYHIKINEGHRIGLYVSAGIGGNIYHTDQVGLAVPIGGGIQWRNGDQGPWSIGIEALGRMTTDKPDGIYTGSASASIPPNNFFFDIYKMLGIRVSYTLFDCECPKW